MMNWTSPRPKQGQVSEREALLRHMNWLLTDDGLLVLGLPGKYPSTALSNLNLLLENTGFHQPSIGQVYTPHDSTFNQLVAIAKKTGRLRLEPLDGSKLNLKFSSGRVERRLRTGRLRVRRNPNRTEASRFFLEGADVREVLK